MYFLCGDMFTHLNSTHISTTVWTILGYTYIWPLTICKDITNQSVVFLYHSELPRQRFFDHYEEKQKPLKCIGNSHSHSCLKKCIFWHLIFCCFKISCRVSPSYVIQAPTFQSILNKLFWPHAPSWGQQLNTLNRFYIIE